MNFNLVTLVPLTIFVVIFALLILLLRSFLAALGPEPGEATCTWKFRTVIYVVLAVAIPLWPLTFPLFVLMGYRSYLAGAPKTGTPA